SHRAQLPRAGAGRLLPRRPACSFADTLAPLRPLGKGPLNELRPSPTRLGERLARIAAREGFRIHPSDERPPTGPVTRRAAVAEHVVDGLRPDAEELGGLGDREQLRRRTEGAAHGEDLGDPLGDRIQLIRGQREGYLKGAHRSPSSSSTRRCRQPSSMARALPVAPAASCASGVAPLADRDDENPLCDGVLSVAPNSMAPVAPSTLGATGKRHHERLGKLSSLTSTT